MKWTDEHDDALEALQEALDPHEDFDGYPAEIDGQTIPGYVVVAHTDAEGAADLMIIRWPPLLRWYRDALKFLQEQEEFQEEDEDDDPDYGIGDAMHDTWPAGIDLTRPENIEHKERR